MRFGAYGHLDDKLEFIENVVHSCIFYDVFDVGGYVGSSLLEVSLLYLLGIPPLPLLITSRCFDATRRLVSNKLEFAQFGAHMQKLWQFWFPSSSTAWVLQAVGPLLSGSTAGSPQP